MNNTVHCLVLSKQRPMLFHMAVSSVIQNLPQVKDFTFLINLDDNKYETPYFDCLDEFPITHNLFIDHNFHNDLVACLEDIAEENEYVLLMTDDTLVFRTCPHDLISPFKDPDVLTLGLRLGENTVIQDPNDFSNRMKVDGFVDSGEYGGCHRWIWWAESMDKNTGYPISMDGHVYRTKDILKLTEDTNFTNLREWEGELIGNSRSSNPHELFFKKSMACYRQSCTVNIPINQVQHPFIQKVSPYSMSNEHMLDLFKNGYRVDAEKTVEGITIQGSHQNLELKFKKVK